jgi:hypothetical protein
MLVATAKPMALPMRRNCVAEPIATALGNLQYSFDLAWGVVVCERGGREGTNNDLSAQLDTEQELRSCPVLYQSQVKRGLDTRTGYH